jgi:hypothetical protein
MPWILCRLTTDLTADGAWHGLALGAAGGPSAGAIFPVGTGHAGAAQVFDGNKILASAQWCTADGSPVAGEGAALDLQPVIVGQFPHPTNAAQSTERLLVGAAVSLAAWAPVLLEVGPAGRATIRQSAADATGVSGAARIALYYWAR